MSKKKDKAKEKVDKPKFRLTGRHLVTTWLVLILAGTGAWYVTLGMPNAKEIKRLESSQTRTERDLDENRERVAQIQEQIQGLEQELVGAEEAYAAFAPYVTEAVAPAEHIEHVSARLATSGLTITNTDTPPSRWTPTAPQHYTITYAIDASGTFASVLAALTAIEQEEAGLSIDELQVVKSGGDPNDPTLTARLAITAHARKAPESN